jgi:small conductance mechanosensitive channel
MEENVNTAILLAQVDADSIGGLQRFWDWIQTQGPQWIVTNGLAILITLGITMVALRIARALAGRLTALLTRNEEDAEVLKRAQTLSEVVRWVLRLVILIVAGMMILDKLGVQIGPVIAAAGIAGLAVGFGAQTLVSDLISGFFILLEDQVRVGDVVSLNDRGGLVERINLRMIVLRDLAGNVHYVRNGQINVVTNMTKGYSRYVFDIGVAYRENVDEVIAVVKKIDEELRQDPAFKDDILAPIEILGLDKFDSSAVVIKARTMTRPIQQWRVGREFNRRMKQRFDELGIEIPFPHITLYPGKDKQGNSPSLVVQVQGGQPPPPAGSPP